MIRFFVIIISTILWINSYSQDGSLQKSVLKYPNGTVMAEATTLNGRKHGESRTYYPNGVLKTKNNWRNDVQIGETKSWYSNGFLNYEGSIKYGYENGLWRYYDELDCDSIYDLYYKYGKIDSVRYYGNKYRWREINLALIDFKFQFPTYLMDSMYVPDRFIGFWAMYPYELKKEIEFYSVIRFDKKIELDYFTYLKKDSLKLEDRLLLAKFFGAGRSYDPSVPSLDFDDFKLTQGELIQFNGIQSYAMTLFFTDIEVEFRAVIVPFSDGYQVISAYFNKDVPQVVRDHFFDSFQLK
jgi:hypothetical protein